jgi:hypothetical protein
MKKQRPSDINQRAKLIVDIATGEKEEPKSNKNKVNIEMGRLGGEIRAKNLSSERKVEIAKQAANKRWNKS